MIPYPVIPEVETGQALGATVLNAYHKAVRYLLGRSHEPITVQNSPQLSTYGTSWKRMYSWWLPYRGDRINYHYALSTSSAGKTAYLELRYVGDDTNEHVALADSTTGSKTGASTLTAGTHYGTSMTAGQIYEWRAYLKGADGSNYAICDWWELSTYYNAVTGWAAPHTFVADAVSAAANLNIFKTDCAALKTYRLDGAKGFTVDRSIFYTSGSTSWLEAARFCYRYRPQMLRFNVWCDMTPSPGVYWQWQISGREWGSATWTTLYTQPVSTKYGNLSGGEWGTECAVNIGSLVGGLAFGDWVQLKVEIKASAASNLQCQRYYGNRYSSLAPAAGWAAMTDFVEGDSDIGPTNLNKISTNLVMLYSGAEALWGYTAATGMGGNTVDDGDANIKRHSGVHLHRWLHYKPASGSTPTIWYGPNTSRTLTLGTDAGWQAYDMEGSEIWPGLAYEISGCEGVFESDSSAI